MLLKTGEKKKHSQGPIRTFYYNITHNPLSDSNVKGLQNYVRRETG